MTPTDLSMSSDEAVVWDVATNVSCSPGLQAKHALPTTRPDLVMGQYHDRCHDCRIHHTHCMHHAFQAISGRGILTRAQLQRFRTLQKDTNLLVNRLIKLVIETGCATGTASQSFLL